ncbi:AAA family ATPase [Aeromonas sobria]|uniref:AAA family ATPase n=1 Tax=Aeromonas sobria TaxID=646 RepID=UPI0011186693|nr:AAA family ATPase [Aeromonas sobria]
MLGLSLQHLKILVNTTGGTYGIDVPFSKGLNIIRAENSSGKSTFINAIAYALGLEDILGPSRKKPFPRSVVTALHRTKNDEKELLVKSSYVELVILSNSGRKAKLVRDITGLPDKVTVTEEGKEEDYFLGSAGTIGSAKSQRGFHYWLERFIGWKLPTLTTFDGKPSKLYLECIFPLFFIEQKRGWSELQANTPTHYGIKNLKKSALDFTLGLEDYDKQNKVAELTLISKSLINDWDLNQTAATALAEFVHAHIKVNSKINDEASSIDSFEYFVEGINSQSEIKSLISALKINLSSIKNGITTWPLSKELDDKIIALQQINRKLSAHKQMEESERISLSKLEIKISKIKKELDSYRQLKRLQDVGSQKKVDVKFEKCPICNSAMHEALCDSNQDIQPLTIEQNVDYLKNQLEFYLGIKNNHEQKLKDLHVSIVDFGVRQKVIENDIQTLKSDEQDHINTLIESGSLRKKLELESRIKELTKITDQLNKYNVRAHQIQNEWAVNSGALEKARKSAEFSVSAKIVSELETILKRNLRKFGFDQSNINYVQISRQTLRPEFDGYDIVADSSASDYIRIIWSYTLALLELGVKLPEVKHGGFIIFDEPRQHEANKSSFKSLLLEAEAISQNAGQIIVATSIGIEDLNSFAIGDAVNLVAFNDGEYILQAM